MSVSAIFRYRKSQYYDNFLKEKGVSKENFEKEDVEKQLSLIKKYFEDNGLKLPRSKNNSTVKEDSSIMEENNDNISIITNILNADIDDSKKVELIKKIHENILKERKIELLSKDIEKLRAEIEAIIADIKSVITPS